MSGRIFLDAHATTPVDPAVIEAMLPWLRQPANSHAGNAMGREAAAAVERARAQVAALIGAEPDEIVFVPSATVATNIALRSLARPGTTALRSAIEHPCVVGTLADLEPAVTVAEIPVDDEGLVDVDAVAEAAEHGASVVAVMAVNNEVGTVQPVREIGALCGYLSVPFFADLAQAAGRIPLDVRRDLISAGAVSSHKVYGPQGIGALFCERSLMPVMRPVTSGGGQERGLSPGTLPTALCVGFGEACALALAALAAETVRLGGLRDRLRDMLGAGISSMAVNGSMEHRVAGNLNVSFPGVDADALLALIPDVVASTGSACSSGAIAPSPVLVAMGLPEPRIAGAVRFGLGRQTTIDDMDRAAALVIAAVKALRTETRP
ncbi:cysteine desulfurase family protein [Sphingomonas sp. CFBP 13733]|uniref:cysteine desulfurase family protein n=1 Tax=Sphingomonas sp. CFBP 13733 TaxID=2775291 RepID=UPI00177CE65C|nr:cysteine desulfurase family protein [Sphingomonas sp. CFBP 13733]MBD8640240.1 cysteine desulfurase [Sphingomonas sp. CFBP 13733]